jgi:hypothetical protein
VSKSVLVEESIALPEIKVGDVQHNHSAHKHPSDGDKPWCVTGCAECAKTCKCRVPHGYSGKAPALDAWDAGLRPNCAACMGENK